MNKKKIISVLISMLLLMSLVAGCSSSKKNSNDGNNASKSEANDESTVKENVKNFEKGSKLDVDGLKITVKNIKFTNDILPDKTEGVYNHFPADKDKVYLEIDTDIKNTNKQDQVVEKIGRIELDYDNGYEYKGWLIPEDSQTGFSYANIKSIKPLETMGIRWAVELPKEVEETKKPVKITLTIGDEKYVCKFR
ncbi:M10 family metallopeptidase C-terminal domain-containing protein [Clostridium sardiniense]|uniref:M10 family metallopeptidase C-terminal domain-containing protein n=1 Tax=Clostridium sardiniense TaxID=29369 RepID=UPI00195A8DA1|nr:M10 family metallopeptidase C-terminal domain-containing protein [Clostridium sardiniense]MBM7835728.1 regulatory protein YycI of two-component signal transduction system YycFG [Clostridium sardiniense]